MKEYDIFVPLYYNDGNPIEPAKFQDLQGICSSTNCSRSRIGDLTTTGPFGIKTEKIRKHCRSNPIYR